MRLWVGRPVGREGQAGPPFSPLRRRGMERNGRGIMRRMGIPSSPGRAGWWPAVRPVPAVGAGLALVLATLAAALAFAAYQLPRNGAAETAYLGTLAAVVLAAAAAVSPRPALAAGMGAVAAVTALWVLPAGEGRGVVVGLVLVAAFLAAALGRLAEAHERLGLALALPLAVGAQALLRGERWLAPRPDLRTLVVLLGLPVVAAIAAVLLARRQGARSAAVAVATALLLAPGLDVRTTLALVALAAGQEALDAGRSRPWRLAALAALVAPVAWEPRSGAVAALAGLTLGGASPFAAAAAVAGVALAFLAPQRSWLAAAALLVWLPLLLPGLVWPGRRWPRLAAAASLALAAARCVPGTAALAAPLALAAFAMAPAGVLGAAQRAWTAVLFAGTALLAAYPWLRQAPLADALGLAGMTPGWVAAAAVVAAIAALAAAAWGAAVLRLRSLFPRRRRSPPPWSPGRAELHHGLLGGRRWSPRVAVAVVVAAAGLALWLALPPAGKVLVEGAPVVVDRERAKRGLWLEEPRVSAVVVDSQLVNAAGLGAGTLVATLRLTDPAGAVHEHPLRAGEETGEWAARRPDVAALPGLAVPPAWRSRVDPGGFFAQTYRDRWRLAEPAGATYVEVERAPDLPPEVVLLLFRVELVP
jgi:hypothetical protein